MKITLPLVRPAFDDDRIIEKIKRDFEKYCKIGIYKNKYNCENDKISNSFSLCLEYGKDKKKALIWFDVDLHDLEIFANSLMKSIEMLRRDYS